MRRPPNSAAHLFTLLKNFADRLPRGKEKKIPVLLLPSQGGSSDRPRATGGGEGEKGENGESSRRARANYLFPLSRREVAFRHHSARRRDTGRRKKRTKKGRARNAILPYQPVDPHRPPHRKEGDRGDRGKKRRGGENTPLSLPLLLSYSSSCSTRAASKEEKGGRGGGGEKRENSRPMSLIILLTRRVSPSLITEQRAQGERKKKERNKRRSYRIFYNRGYPFIDTKRKVSSISGPGSISPFS